jgi:hypothetical protein
MRWMLVKDLQTLQRSKLRGARSNRRGARCHHDPAGLRGQTGFSSAAVDVVSGVVDELALDIAPVLLGSGERIFDGVESLGMEPIEVLHSPLATHIRYLE